MTLPLNEIEIADQDAALRRLACRLVADPADVDDLVQDTWLAAIERPPNRFLNIGGWLHRVTHHSASRLRRRRDQRLAREHAVARRDVSPSALELELRDEPLRLLAECVEELPEPYLSVLRLRFFEGLGVEAISRRLERPVTTLRSQLQRGLARVRDSLDRKHGGERMLWLSSLAGVVGPGGGGEGAGSAGAGTASVSGGLLGVPLPIFAAAMAALVGLPLWLGWQLGAAHERGARSERDGALPAVAAGGAEGAAQPDSAGDERADVGNGARTAVAVPQSAPAAGLARLRVHARSRDEGAPLAGLGITLERLGGRDRDVELVTDGGGRAVAAELSPGEWRVAPRRGPARTVWLAAGLTTEVAVVLSPGSVIDGHVLDYRGQPVEGAEVWLSLPDRPDRGYVAARTDVAGRYHLEGVDERSWLGVRDAAGSMGPVYSLCSPGYRGLSEDVALQLPDLLRVRGNHPQCRGRVVDADGAPVAGATVEVGVDPLETPLTDRIGQTWQWPPALAVTTDADGRFACSRVLAERNHVRVTAPGYATWHGLSLNDPSHELVIELVGESSLRGRLVQADGTPAAGAVVALEPPPPYAAVVTRAGEEGEFLVRGLPAGRARLRAEVGGAGLSLVRDVELPIAAEAWVAGTLDHAASVRGSVHDERGSPLAGWWVALRPEGGGGVRRVRTDADGAYAFGALDSQPYRIAVIAPEDPLEGERSWIGGLLPGEEPGVLIVPDEARPSAWIAGRLEGLEAEELFGTRLSLAPKDGGPAVELAPALGADGRGGTFEVGPVLPGAYALSLQRPGVGRVPLCEVTVARGERRDLGVLPIAAPGSFELTLVTPDGLRPERLLVELERTPLLWTLLVPGPGPPTGLTVDADGKLRGGPLPPGSYELRVMSGVYADLREDVEITAGETTRIERVLTPGEPLGLELSIPAPLPAPASIEVRFVHDDGRVYPDRIHLPVAFGDTHYFYTLPPGHYTVEVRHDGRLVGSAECQHPTEGRRLTRVPVELRR